MMGNIEELIGQPALLEQLAEEATELAKAALKQARILRGENPTPITYKDAYDNLIEEYTDVTHCAFELNLKVDKDQIYRKDKRWQERVKNTKINSKDISTNKNIIIINGSGGAGKDTFVNFCSESDNVTNISSVDKVKEAARILGWDGSKEDKDRKFLSDLKILSTKYNSNPYEYIRESINKFNSNETSNTMFIHVREPEEIEKLKNEFGCITLLIRNKNKEEIKSNMADANVDEYTYDYVINNDGYLHELKMKAKTFMININLR